jgi:hypothetical protein
VAVIVAVVAGVLVVGGGIVAFLWYAYAERSHSTHGVRFRVSGFGESDMSAAEVSQAGTDWAVRLGSIQNGGYDGRIELYGTGTSSHAVARQTVGASTEEMRQYALDEHATHIDGPDLVSLPADGTALVESWQGPEGDGRYYTLAVGRQLIEIVCVDSPHPNTDALGPCQRIAQTIAPTG